LRVGGEGNGRDRAKEKRRKHGAMVHRSGRHSTVEKERTEVETLDGWPRSKLEGRVAVATRE